MVWTTEAVHPSGSQSIGGRAGCGTDAHNDFMDHSGDTIESRGYDGIAWATITSTGTVHSSSSFFEFTGNDASALVVGGTSSSSREASTLWSGAAWVTGPTLSKRQSQGTAVGTTSDALTYGTSDSAYNYMGGMRFNGTTWSTIPNAFYARTGNHRTNGSPTSAMLTGGNDVYNAATQTEMDNSYKWNGSTWSGASILIGRRQHHCAFGPPTGCWVTCGSDDNFEGAGQGDDINTTEFYDNVAWATDPATHPHDGNAAAHGTTGFKTYTTKFYGISPSNNGTWGWTLDNDLAALTGVIEMSGALTRSESKNVYKDLARPRIDSVVPSQFDWGASVRINTKNIADTSGRKVWIGGVEQTVTGTGVDYIDFTVVQGTNQYGTAQVTVEGTWQTGDDDWEATELFLEVQGADESTTLTDTSFDPKTLAFAGNSRIDTGQIKFGISSGYNAGALGDHINLGNRTLYFNYNEPLTVEAWIYVDPAASSSKNHPIIAAQSGANPAIYWNLDYTTGSNRRAMWFGYGGIGTWEKVSMWAPTDSALVLRSQWVHCALCRNAAGIWSMFQDGVLMARATENSAVAGPSADLYIGRHYNGSFTQNAQFWFSHYRIYRGVDRYYESFEPPTVYKKFRS